MHTSLKFVRCRPALPGVALLFFLLLCLPSGAQESPWVRPQKPGDPLLWGRRDGVVFGLMSAGGLRGPRGLIRVGFYPAGTSQPELLNFLAVEPVVRGPGRRFDRMGFSELEMSALDGGVRGKRMSVHTEGVQGYPEGGTLQTVRVGNAVVERLSVRIDVERFALNGAHVYAVVSVDSDHPGELRVQGYAEKDSAPLEELAVTATMGNYERLRLLWLQDRVEDSRRLFAAYDGDAFIEGQSYPLREMIRTSDGDALVFCTTDEASPKDTPGNATAHWPYALPRRTQYWRVPGYDVEPDLRARVNARRVYWGSTAPVLGGIAFENFELRQRYVEGQSFVFGITPKEPYSFLQDVLRGEAPGLAHPDLPVPVNAGATRPEGR